MTGDDTVGCSLDRNCIRGRHDAGVEVEVPEKKLKSNNLSGLFEMWISRGGFSAGRGSHPVAQYRNHQAEKTWPQSALAAT